MPGLRNQSAEEASLLLVPSCYLHVITKVYETNRRSPDAQIRSLQLADQGSWSVLLQS